MRNSGLSPDELDVQSVHAEADLPLPLPTEADLDDCEETAMNENERELTDEEKRAWDECAPYQ